ncbi:MAG: adenylosuccinate synthetase [Patescibacteria group bacterium]|nr:adenylosuccinate synthetase [Patescibacteria group bacterium]
MSKFQKIYKQVYEKNNLFDINKKLKKNPLVSKGKRKNSVAVVGGALGDEGKGRVTDELTAHFMKTAKKAIHYRDNGGANAGHTVEVGDVRLALHQLSSGVMQAGCTVICGKEMVLHPEDLVEEINQVKKATSKKKMPADLIIDEMALLCLDTHRAFEAVLKMKSRGSKPATGRGISPAYADRIYRHPLRMRDLANKNWQNKFKKHYQFYQTLISGFGLKLAELEVPRLNNEKVRVGSATEMLARLEKARAEILPYIQSVYDFIKESWEGDTPFVFEKAQALGLDKRWGVYPDVTASNCGFEGILSSTEGVTDPEKIAIKTAVIKATYTSSVGARKLPTIMEEKLAHKIREDANEYGATTGRPRDIVHIDLPMLSYLFRVGRVEYSTITHMDVSYPDVPIRVCVAYEIDGKEVHYRPDQQFLNKVSPRFVELPAWDGKRAEQAKKIEDLPQNALSYLAFINQCLGTKLLLITTGPKREQTIKWY